MTEQSFADFERADLVDLIFSVRVSKSAHGSTCNVEYYELASNTESIHFV